MSRASVTTAQYQPGWAPIYRANTAHLRTVARPVVAYLCPSGHRHPTRVMTCQHGTPRENR